MSPESTLIDGKYTILSKLREGGMGTIYKVRHNLLDEIRVIKFMRPAVSGDAELDHRFLQEARLVTRFNHPNIAAVYDFSVDDEGTAYIVMEYVEGMNLIEMMRSMPEASMPLLLEIARQTLEALAYLHRKNVVHRDISPDNIMIAIEDGRPMVKLIDLGIAKALDSNDGLTKTGFFLGKLKYASPEQLGSLGADEQLDARSDIYSFSVALYELVTGRLPFRSESPRSLVAAHLFEAPADFELVDSEGRIPTELRDVILRGLQKSRDDRYPDAEAFRTAIESVQRSLPSGISDDELANLNVAIRENHPSDEAIPFTPSVQNRVNRHFAASATTPHPGSSAADATILGTDITRIGADATLVEAAGEATLVTGTGTASAPTLITSSPGPEAVSEGTQSVSSTSATRIEPLPRSQRVYPRVAVAALAALFSIAAVYLVLDRRPDQTTASGPPVVASSASPSTPDLVAAAGEVMATSTISLDPVEAVPATELAPEDPSAAAPPDPSIAHAESARRTALQHRDAAQSAGAERRARLQYRGALRELVLAEQLRQSGNHTQAAARFAEASRLFQAAMRTSRAAADRDEPPAQREPLVAQSEPVSVPATRDTTPARAETPRSEPAPVAAPVRTDEQQIRDLMQEYVAAQEALDADRYAVIYPSVNRGRIQTAFRSFRSQTLDLQIEEITISGDTATVSASERRTAIPRVGTEQTVRGSRTFTVRRNGDAWIIVAVR